MCIKRSVATPSLVRPPRLVQDFYEKECWAHHPKPHQEYMDYRLKKVGAGEESRGQGFALWPGDTMSCVEQQLLRHPAMMGCDRAALSPAALQENQHEAERMKVLPGL
jgi:hypothetical protein